MNGYQRAFFWVVGAVFVIFVGINGWAVTKLITIENEISAIKASRIGEALANKADRRNVPSRDYLEERFKRLEESLARLEKAIQQHELRP